MSSANWLNIATWIILNAALWIMYYCYLRERKQAKKCIDELFGTLERCMQTLAKTIGQRDRYKAEAEQERNRANDLEKLINQMNRKNE